MRRASRDEEEPMENLSRARGGNRKKVLPGGARRVDGGHLGRFSCASSAPPTVPIPPSPPPSLFVLVVPRALLQTLHSGDRFLALFALHFISLFFFFSFFFLFDSAQLGGSSLGCAPPPPGPSAAATFPYSFFCFFFVSLCFFVVCVFFFSEAR